MTRNNVVGWRLLHRTPAYRLIGFYKPIKKFSFSREGQLRFSLQQKQSGFTAKQLLTATHLDTEAPKNAITETAALQQRVQGLVKAQLQKLPVDLSEVVPLTVKKVMSALSNKYRKLDVSDDKVIQDLIEDLKGQTFDDIKKRHPAFAGRPSWGEK